MAIPTNTARQQHVLAMDDDPGVLRLIQALLEDEGYLVSTRSDLHQDLDSITVLAPDLIVIDYLWSGSGNSWPLVQSLRRGHDTAMIPIVLCTATREIMAIEDNLNKFGVDVVYKPFDIDDMLAAVTRNLDGRALVRT